jgi:quercetin dioxygenase-like cupin family protein
MTADTKELKGVPLDLANHVGYADGAIVSKTLMDKKSGTLTLFAFDAGQGLSEHTSPYDATIYVLDGKATLHIAGERLTVPSGQMVIMPADVPHDVRAEEKFKMLLIMIR